MEHFRIINLVVLVIYFLIAELFGRSKHIGRWWTFFLLIFSFILGLLPLIFSPSAKKPPSKGNYIHLIFGIIFLLLACLAIVDKYEFYSLVNIFFDFSMSSTIIAIFPLASLGIYLVQLNRGKIVNKKPKFYFQKSKNNEFSNSLNTPMPPPFKGALDTTEHSFENDFNDLEKSDKPFLTESEDEIKDDFNIEEQLSIANRIQEALISSEQYKSLNRLYDKNLLSKEDYENRITILINEIKGNL